MALTLVSADATKRVEELRARGWRIHGARTSADQRRLEILREEEDRRWQEQRALLVKHLGREPRP